MPKKNRLDVRLRKKQEGKYTTMDGGQMEICQNPFPLCCCFVKRLYFCWFANERQISLRRERKQKKNPILTFRIVRFRSTLQVLQIIGPNSEIRFTCILGYFGKMQNIILKQENIPILLGIWFLWFDSIQLAVQNSLCNFVIANKVSNWVFFFSSILSLQSIADTHLLAFYPVY